MYNKEDIEEIVNVQREFFLKGETLDVNFRIEQLRKLKAAVIANEKDLEKALADDLGRAPLEAYFCDIGSLILELNETIRGLKRWARPETHFSGIHCFPSIVTKVYKMPYGVSLIISPFNFPVLLSLGVLTASLAGGNTAVIKTSSKSVHCTEVVKRIVAETFPPEYVTVIDGGHDVADMCLQQRFDKIFYTGSPKVGVHVLEEAARNLTSTALELGGETGNWAIVRKDADIKDAARKIAFFKILNSGQICINVNQVAVAEEISEEFVKELKNAFNTQIGDNPTVNSEYPHLINEGAYKKCADTADKYRDRIVLGGFGDEVSLRYAPTVIFPVDKDEEIVQRELFCPLLPVVTYKDAEIDGLLDAISRREKGLSLYLFTRDIKWAKKTMQRMQFGGGCINEVCLHMMVKGVPFNGVGHSGMGAYHGKWGFMEFTHPQTVLIGSNKFNLSMREHPYSAGLKGKLIRLFEK
ncbi:aldehyde dehydrogenase (NAD+) [Butyrivibrio sp. INlla18]|uniref:aldehyde dehydrogenase family protein n=1 Tax=Butyrivibrio sp. INlla18 TaxID=1520806 RepID=UPI00088D5930|nr:aldehyde dehydrogenase family protein [Butyrivibrio sp. INlla18]SDA54264.1 aldehyde dehydrogenase (NAD+) [Butyrivibrio sp. INlla18]